MYTILPWKWTRHICRARSRDVFKFREKGENGTRKELQKGDLYLVFFVGKRNRDTKVGSGMNWKYAFKISSFFCLCVLPIIVGISFKEVYGIVVVQVVCISKPVISVGRIGNKQGKASMSAYVKNLSLCNMFHTYTCILYNIWFIYLLC